MILSPTKRTIDAVIRNFEVLGEASKRITEEVRVENPQIEWRKISDFRNVLIHDYLGINYEILLENNRRVFAGTI